jgi:hypothetical protein
MIKMLLPYDAHSRWDMFSPKTFQGWACTEAKIRHTIAILGDTWLKRNLFTRHFWWKSKLFKFVSLQAFPSYRPLKKAWVDSPTAVIDRVKCIYKGDE